MKNIISALTVIAICATIATAAEKKKGGDKSDSEDPVKKSFKQLDTNHDGFISLAEWKAASKMDSTKTDALFKAKDKNADGKLTLYEYRAEVQVSDATGAAAKPKFTKQQVERRLRELKDFLDKGLIKQDFYDRKVKECETGQ